MQWTRLGEIASTTTHKLRIYSNAFYDKLYEQGKNLCQLIPTKNQIESAFSFGKKAIGQIREQIPSPFFFHQVAYRTLGLIPAAFLMPRSWLTHEPSKQAIQKVLLVLHKDTIPLLLTSYLLDSANNYLNYLVLFALKITVHNKFFQKKNTSHHYHSTLELITLPSELSSARNKNVKVTTLCEDKKCGAINFGKGSIQGALAYYFVRYTILLLATLLPKNLQFIPQIYLTYHDGRTIIAYGLPGVCYEHSRQYSKQQPATAFAFGIGMFLLSGIISGALSYATTIPSDYFDFYLNTVYLLIMVSMSAHYNFNNDVEFKEELKTDVIDILEFIFEILFLIYVMGGTKVLPRYFAKTEKKMTWQEIVTLAENKWHSPEVNHVKKIFLPDYMQDKHKFINDPILSNRWCTMRESIHKTFNIILKYKQQYQLAIQGVLGLPKAACEKVVIELGKELNIKPLWAKRLLKLIKNNDFVEAIYHGYLTIDSLEPGNKLIPQVPTDKLPLPGAPIILQSSPEVPENEMLVAQLLKLAPVGQSYAEETSPQFTKKITPLQSNTIFKAKTSEDSSTTLKQRKAGLDSGIVIYT